MLEAFAANPGKGVIALDRRMLEALDAEDAARTLARATDEAMRLYDEALARGEFRADAAQANAARRLHELAGR